MTFPKNWEIFALNGLVDVLDNQRIPVNSSERSKRLGPVPYYGATGQVGTIDEAIFNEELLILGEDGVQFFDPNKPKAYKISGPSWVNNHAHVLRAKQDKVLQNYLLHFLNQFNYVGYANGTTRLKLTQGAMNSIPVPLPSIDEQHKIVELLEDYLSRLDAALTYVKQAKIKATQFRRSLLQAAFVGHLSDKSFTIGSEIPPSWRKITLGNVLEPRKQKDIPSTFPNLPYIGMEHVARDVGLVNSFGDSADYRSAAPRVFKGDVLYGRLRPYLNKVAISPCEAFASGEFIVLPPNEEIIGKFLQLRLLSQDFVEFAGTLDTGDRPRVSWEQISRFQLALPPIDEQMKMISSLEEHLSRLDASVSLADAMEKQSTGLRRSLLQAAFTGQLTKEVVNV